MITYDWLADVLYWTISNGLSPLSPASHVFYQPKHVSRWQRSDGGTPSLSSRSLWQWVRQTSSAGLFMINVWLVFSPGLARPSRNCEWELYNMYRDTLVLHLESTKEIQLNIHSNDIPPPWRICFFKSRDHPLHYTNGQQTFWWSIYRKTFYAISSQ